MSNISVTRIAKASFKDGQLLVVQRCRSSDTERTINISCSKTRCHPDLEAAFDACGSAVREILEWPSTLYGNRLRITGATWSHSENTDVEGACITFQVDLEDSNSPFCGTTPHLPYEQYSESGEQPVMPDGGIDALNALKSEVERFLNGKRAQGDLFERAEERYGIPAETLREHAE
jgi:hypothetical protein